ncbi:MAG: DUF1593 domain-containing protein, partial [Chitinispirillia bacterium]
MKKLNFIIIAALFLCTIINISPIFPAYADAKDRPRIIITSDAEADDEMSFNRCLLYANELEIEGIITTSSQFHWHGYKWAGDNWYVKYLDAYEKIHFNLLKHDKRYPTAEYLRSVAFLGNADAKSDMKAPTPGSDHIVKVLMDETDDRPVWLQAWGGMNSIARALK